MNRFIKLFLTALIFFIPAHLQYQHLQRATIFHQQSRHSSSHNTLKYNKIIIFVAMKQLLYEIAEHRIVINTPNEEVTEKLIASFKPFKLKNGEKDDVLFQFSGSKKIAIPNGAPDDEMKVDGMTFEVYQDRKSVV